MSTAETVHKMMLLHTYDDMSEHWLCTVCKREFILSWPPNYAKDVIVPGDADVKHVGSKNGATIDLVSIDQEQDLDAFTSYIESMNLDDLLE